VRESTRVDPRQTLHNLEGVANDSTKRANKVSDGTNRGSVSWRWTGKNRIARKGKW